MEMILWMFGVAALTDSDERVVINHNWDEECKSGGCEP